MRVSRVTLIDAHEIPVHDTAQPATMSCEMCSYSCIVYRRTMSMKPRMP
jgi:hypothetical protein